jgi:thymidylate kinase
MDNLYVINIFGGPGAGKSTVAAQLFSIMKVLKYDVALVKEYAEELVLEDRMNILIEDQLSIFAEQHRRLQRLRGKCQWVVTDSPLLLNIVYNQHEDYFGNSFTDLVVETFDKFNNINILLRRNPNAYHSPLIRRHDLHQSMKLDQRVDEVVYEYGDNFIKIDLTDDFLHGPSVIMKIIQNRKIY